MIKMMFFRLIRHRLAALAAGCLVVLVVVAIFAPWLSTHPPRELVGTQFEAPSGAHWLGTDQLARDVYSRLLHGARISVRVAALAVLIALICGTMLGLIAGYVGGWIDGILSRVTDVMFSLPEIVLALVIMAVLGQSLMNVTIAIGVVYTPIFARVCRGAVLSVKARPYVEAVEALGASHLRIMLRHVLPNVMSPLLVQMTLSFAFAILAEAALSFLGLAGESDIPSWGMMLREGYQNMYDPRNPWWLIIAPGLAISIVVLCFNVLGDGLQDMLDPKDDRTR